METRANYLIIGLLTLALIIGAFAFVLLLVGGGPTFDTYRVYFRGAVDGLGVGSDVRYNGIKVGSVSKIILDQDDPSRVKVTIQVASGTPIREDSVASLAAQGITGISYIQIASGYGASPPLKPKGGELYARIPSKQSGLQAAIQSLPNVLKNSNDILKQIKRIVSDSNQRKISAILDNAQSITNNINILTARVASKSEQVGGIIDNLDRGAASLSEAAALINGIAGDANKAIVAINRFAVTLRDLVVQNRRPINEFVSNGLSQFTRLMTEARQMVATVSRVADRINSDPARFIFGTQRPEYAPK